MTARREGLAETCQKEHHCRSIDGRSVPDLPYKDYSTLLRHRHSRENGNPVFLAFQIHFLLGGCVLVTASSGFLLPQE